MALSERIPRGLVVSAQAPEGSPLRFPDAMAAMAEAAHQAGAAGIRAQGTADIAAIMSVCQLPMIGIIKRNSTDSDVYITPGVQDARALAELGVPIVATDMTGRYRPGGEDIADIVEYLHDRDILVMADVASAEEGIRAAERGADLVGTTLVPHLHSESGAIRPNFSVLAELIRRLPGVPVVAEGGYSTPSDVTEALRLGAQCVVVGRAITDPLALAQDFVEASRLR